MILSKIILESENEEGDGTVSRRKSALITILAHSLRLHLTVTQTVQVPTEEVP